MSIVPDVVKKAFGFGAGKDEGDAVAVDFQFFEPFFHAFAVGWVEVHSPEPWLGESIVMNGEVMRSMHKRRMKGRARVKIERTQLFHEFGRCEPLYRSVFCSFKAYIHLRMICYKDVIKF